MRVAEVSCLVLHAGADWPSTGSVVYGSPFTSERGSRGDANDALLILGLDAILRRSWWLNETCKLLLQHLNFPVFQLHLHCVLHPQASNVILELPHLFAQDYQRLVLLVGLAK